MHDEFYSEVDEMGHYDIDEDEIAKANRGILILCAWAIMQECCFIS